MNSTESRQPDYEDDDDELPSQQSLELQSISTKVNEHISSLSEYGPHAETFKNELLKLLSEYRRSVENVAEIARSADDVDSEKHVVREQAAAAKRICDDSAAQRKELEDKISFCNEREKFFRAAAKSKTEEIAVLNTQNTELKEELQMGSGWTSEQVCARQDLVRQIENEKSHLHELRNGVDAVRSDMEKIETNMKILEDKRTETLRDTDRLEQAAAATRVEVSELTNAKRRLEEEQHDLKRELKRRQADLEVREVDFRAAQVRIDKTEGQLKDAKVEMECHLRQYNELLQQSQKLNEELKAQNANNVQLGKENERKKDIINNKKGDVQKVLKEVAIVKKQRELLSQKISAVEADRSAHESERDNLRIEIHQIDTVETKLARKESEVYKREIDGLKREEEILNRKVSLSEKGASLVFDLVKVNENTLRNLDNELAGLQKTVKRSQNTVNALSREKEHQESLVRKANEKTRKALDTAKSQDEKIEELQKQLVEEQAALKQQKQQYEDVKNDQQVQSKILLERHEQIDKTKRHFQRVLYQMEQVKKEVRTTEKELAKQQSSISTMEEETLALENECQKLNQRIDAADENAASVSTEIRNLYGVIEKATEEKCRLQKDYNNKLIDRDIFDSQLVQQRQKLTDLQTKIKLSRSALHYGELQYQDRLAALSAAAADIRSLAAQKRTLSQNAAKRDELQRECTRLERSLLRLRIKNRALTDETTSRMTRRHDVHRWRHLENSDPTRFGMIQKVMALQKRVIGMADEILVKDHVIAEKEALYKELEAAFLKSRPSLEAGVREELDVYEKHYEEKVKQRKQMGFELDVYKHKVASLREELLEFQRKKRELNGTWLQMKCDEMRSRELSLALESSLEMSVNQ